jgi:hypothetical protein
VTTCAGLAGCGALGVLTFSHRLVGFLAAGLVGVVGLLVADPLLVPVAAFPATLFIQRAGPGGFGSSVTVSELVLLCAVAVALPRVRWKRAVCLRRALVPTAAYEVLMIFTVVAHPNAHDSLEWANRLLILVGSLVVGWVVAASGRARQAVTALLIGCMVLAVLAMEHAVTLHFQPAEWGGTYVKNYIGSMMWMGAAVAHLNPPWLAVPRRLARAAKYLCVLGLLASQSKQSIFALVVVVLVAGLFQPSVRRRSRLLLVSLVPLLVAAYFILVAEIAQSHHNFNTLAIRQASYAADLHIWLLDPIFGQGMRWFYLPHFSGYIQPPDIIMETLTETGIIGIVALLVLLGGSTRVFLMLPRSVGTIALVLVLGRAFEAMFDSYWVSALVALPFLLGGVALGVWDAGLVSGSQIGASGHREAARRCAPAPADRAPDG